MFPWEGYRGSFFSPLSCCRRASASCPNMTPLIENMIGKCLELDACWNHELRDARWELKLSCCSYYKSPEAVSPSLLSIICLSVRFFKTFLWIFQPLYLINDYTKDAGAQMWVHALSSTFRKHDSRWNNASRDHRHRLYSRPLKQGWKCFNINWYQ